MPTLRLLLDTNIFIALEDPHVVPPDVALLSKKAQLHGITLYVEDASIRDVERDKDQGRRLATLSKLSKFPRLENVAHSSTTELEAKFGSSRKANDICDVFLLDTLDLDVVDFLVSEDAGLHKRAHRAGLSDRVFTVREALAWLQRTFDPKDFELPFIVSKKAHQISLTDPLFDTLREDYFGFDDWFAKCRRQHRDCWVVEIEGELAGLVVYKSESREEARPKSLGTKILKVCTFKMKREFQGEKFGEQLLKKILWYAQGNAYDCVYLTAFPKQQFLLTLLKTFGFEVTRTETNGEFFVEKELVRSDMPIELLDREPLECSMHFYPRFYSGMQVSKYVIPIRGQFHSVLFPEIAEAPTLPLFPDAPTIVGTQGKPDRTPGNTIRKVYVCRSPTRDMQPGDVLLFYLSKTESLVRSQSLTTVAVIEKTQLAETIEELQRLVGRRSVYARLDLEAWLPAPERPVLVIDFLLCGHLEPAIPLLELIELGVFSQRPPQSIKKLTQQQFLSFEAHTRLTYS